MLDKERFFGAKDGCDASLCRAIAGWRTMPSEFWRCRDIECWKRVACCGALRLKLVGTFDARLIFIFQSHECVFHFVIGRRWHVLETSVVTVRPCATLFACFRAVMGQKMHHRAAWRPEV